MKAPETARMARVCGITGKKENLAA